MSTPLIQNENFVKVAAPLGVGILFLLFWEIAVQALEMPKYILPGPIEIFKALIDGWQPLLGALYITLKVTFLAFVIAVVLGVAASLLFVQSKWIEMSLFPYAVLMQVTPVVAIAPLIIIWVDDTNSRWSASRALTTHSRASCQVACRCAPRLPAPWSPSPTCC